MASLVYNNFMGALLKGDIDLDEGQDDIRVALLMTNTTADTEDDADVINDFSTLDEMDGANYSRKTLSSQAVSVDDANTRAEFDIEDLTWTALGNGTRDIQGMLIFKFVSDDSDSIPLFFAEFSSAQSPGGSDFTVTINAEGLLQLSQA